MPQCPCVLARFGVLAFGFLAGVVGRQPPARMGVSPAAIGAYLGLMFGFPLLAIGLSNS